MLAKCPHLTWQRLPGHRDLKGRAGHTATLVGKQIFVFGGRNGNEFFNDLWAFDIEIEEWTILQQRAPFPCRAYHTATLVDHHLWVIGGSDPHTMYNDVHVLDTISLKWSSPVMSGLKRRGTHAAVAHPLQEKSILIYGGYGGAESSWMSDLTILHTDSLEWEELEPKGTHPHGRGYHTLTSFGTYVALFGGKSEGGILRDNILSIYDAVSNRWITPEITGEIPCPRSNHVAALLEDNLIVIHGGRHGIERLSDMFILQIPLLTGTSNVRVKGHVLARTKSTPEQKRGVRKRMDTAKKICPGGRSAHSLSVKGHSLYIFGGYGGQGITFNDLFVLRTLPKMPDLEYPRYHHAKKAHTVIDVGEETDEENQEGWRSTKRPRGPMKIQQQQQQQLDMNLVDVKSIHDDSDTRSNKPNSKMNLNVQFGDNLTFLEERTLAMVARENGLYQKEVSSLQKALDSLREIVREKTMIEAELRASKARLKEKEQNLHIANVNLQELLKVQDSKIATGNERVQELEVEVETLKSDIKVLRSELDEKETARQDITLKARVSEQKYEDLARSLEEAKLTASKLVMEKDEYKLCEIAERKETADKLLMELGSLKEFTRAQEETLHNKEQHIEEASNKVEALQREKEELNRANATLSAECKQEACRIEAMQREKEELNCTNAALATECKQKEAEILHLKETAEQTKDHISSLHASLKKEEETQQAHQAEIEKLRALVQESEEFQRAQAKSLQVHADKLQCARQSCPFL